MSIETISDPHVSMTSLQPITADLLAHPNSHTLSERDTPAEDNFPRSEPYAVDPIQEIRLRTWARKHYTAPPSRDDAWHPIVHDEMERKDREAARASV